MLKCLFISISCLMLPGCLSPVENDIVINDNCKRHYAYPTEYRAKAIYTSPDHVAYTAYIDYADSHDFLFSGFSPVSLQPKEIAEMAYFVSVAAEEYILETEVRKGYKLDRIKLELLNTHYVVHDKDNPDPYYWMWTPTLFEEDPEAARETGIVAFFRAPVCYEHPFGVNISTVYKSKDFLNDAVVSHELTHAVGLYLFGDADGDHDNPELWNKLYENSIQARALRMFREQRNQQ